MEGRLQFRCSSLVHPIAHLSFPCPFLSPPLLLVFLLFVSESGTSQIPWLECRSIPLAILLCCHCCCRAPWPGGGALLPAASPPSLQSTSSCYSSRDRLAHLPPWPCLSPWVTCLPCRRSPPVIRAQSFHLRPRDAVCATQTSPRRYRLFRGLEALCCLLPPN